MYTAIIVLLFVAVTFILVFGNLLYLHFREKSGVTLLEMQYQRIKSEFYIQEDFDVIELYVHYTVEAWDGKLVEEKIVVDILGKNERKEVGIILDSRGYKGRVRYKKGIERKIIGQLSHGLYHVELKFGNKTKLDKVVIKGYKTKRQST